MTSGERMVWAAAFDRAMASGIPAPDAAFVARRRVENLAAAREGAQAAGDERTVASIDDMLSSGANR